MKAAIIYPGHAVPQLAEVAEPSVKNGNEMLVTVRAAAIKNLDRSKASGAHYSEKTHSDKGKIIGGDGICQLENRTRAYAVGISGMLAERAVIDKNLMVTVPENLDDATAAALPNGVIGAAMALRFKAQVQPGDTVLINGATGFTGRVAVQVAKHYRAGKIIATGRNAGALAALKNLGADECIVITGNDEDFSRQIAQLHSHTPIDVVIDYLWGRTAEVILGCLKGNGSFTNKIRYVSVGSMGGDTISLSAEWLRSTDIQLTGSGLGSWTKAEVDILIREILPEMFTLASQGKLVVETVTTTLAEISSIWDAEVNGGQRLVVLI